jgi:ADP-heptose:LPS heptosyltransferase
MHVASAFQKPTVVLFGASAPEVALPPWGRFHALQHTEIACVPCLRNHCVRFGAGHNECLRAITVDEAISALRVVAPQLL